MLKPWEVQSYSVIFAFLGDYPNAVYQVTKSNRI